METSLVVKVLLIGDSGVGKSCLLVRYCDGWYEDDIMSTMGIDFRVKKLPQYSYGSARVKMQVWDTAGQERFRAITRSYFRDCHIIIFVYDIGDRSSLNNIHNWIRSAEVNADASVKYMLVGHKSDLRDDVDTTKDLISVREGEELAQEHAIPFIEASALTGNNVTEAFECTLKSILKREDLALIKTTLKRKTPSKEPCAC